MLEELRTASEQLQVVLERYLLICSSIQDTLLLSATPLSEYDHEYARLIDHEVDLVDSYDAKMQKARKAIRTTRNRVFSISPINCLPSEILIRIFHMARDVEPDCVDYLALVCSRWRAVALESFSLWSRINFCPSHSKWLYPKLLSLPRLHASRSGGIPLDVRLSVLSESYADNNSNNGMKDLCALVAPRMRSLQLDFERFTMNWADSNTNSAISRVFSSSTPGMLTKLVTMGYNLCSFFATADCGSPFHLPTRPSSWEMTVGVKRSELEAILAPITVLHLTGVFPPWTSQAYHGLVDLRLCADFNLGGSISELALVRILKSSPGLRILHFGIHVKDRVETTAIRVNLPDLEVLHVGSKQGSNEILSSVEVVRLLNPGPHTLHLSIQNDSLSQFAKPCKIETDAFLARSTVKKFRANDILQPFEFLYSMPNLEVLVLSQCQDLALSTSSDSPPSATYPHIRECIFLDCSMSLSKLRSSIQRFQIQTLEIYRGKFYRDGSTARLDTALVEKELSAVCPKVKMTDVHPLSRKYQDLRVPTDPL